MPKMNNMSRHVNFEDNIFVLNIRIRMIRDLLILDTDAALFLEKTKDDLVFLHSCLASLFSRLKENNRLIERDEQFYNLLETEKQFCFVLRELGEGEGNISVLKCPDLKELVDNFLNSSAERQQSIQEMVVNSKQPAPEPVVSHDELHELLSH